MNNFTVLHTPKWTISFPKNTQSTYQQVILIQDGKSISILKINGKITYNLQLLKNRKRYDMFATNQHKVGLIIADLKTEFNESACPTPLQDPIKKLLQNDLAEKVKILAITDGFISDSCNNLDPIEKMQLIQTAKDELNPKKSFLLQCLNSKETSSKIKSNPKFGALANQVLSAYSNQIEEINQGASKLKINCYQGSKAKADPENHSISLPFEDESLIADKCKTASQVFTHEFTHLAGVNEEDAAYLDSVCGNLLKVPGTKNKSCSDVYKDTIESIQGHGTAYAGFKAQKIATKVEQIKLTNVLKENIKVSEFIPVQDTDIQEISNPTSTATYEASVERVHKAMSTNMEKMAAPLNRAIASTVSTARAESTVKANVRESISKTTIANLRQPASAKATGNEEYVVEEILADKYNVPVETIRAAVAAPNPVDPIAKIPTKAGAPNRGTGEIAATNAGPGGEIAASNSGGGGSATSGGGVAGRSVSSGAKSNSRLPASAGATAGSDPLLEQLGQFNEVRGQRYRQIQERYDDPTFAPELKAKNIAIEYRQNNKTTTIGDTSNSRTLFRDDGKVLKKVTGAR